MIRSDFHTHTTYCDGSSSPREMIERALSLGFTSLGFSSHVPSKSEDYAMTPKGMHAYLREIRALQQEYNGRIDILCGGEFDLFACVDPALFDYTVGSVHYLCKGGVYLAVDESYETERHHVLSYYNGDFDLYAEDYFAHVEKAIKTLRPTFIGHFDLISKFFSQSGYTPTARYLDAAKRCIDALLPLGIPFEVNTGAVARGYADTPYPSSALLSHICRGGGSILFSSDCHHALMLGYGFEEAVRLAKEAGFASYVTLTKSGRKPLPLP